MVVDAGDCTQPLHFPYQINIYAAFAAQNIPVFWISVPLLVYLIPAGDFLQAALWLKCNS